MTGLGICELWHCPAPPNAPSHCNASRTDRQTDTGPFPRPPRDLLDPTSWMGGQGSEDIQQRYEEESAAIPKQESMAYLQKPGGWAA